VPVAPTIAGMLSRRELLQAAGVAVLFPSACLSTKASGAWVNDTHSQLNRTWVDAVRSPRDVDELRRIIRDSRGSLCVAGGRHAMGGQQFASNTTLLDMSSMSRILGIDATSGIIEVEAGIQWPALVQSSQSTPWAIRQKQTGADRLSIGGALAANVHGRGLTMKPFIDDVESFTLVDAGGELVECSRARNRYLFALVIGGYGAFGVVASVKLRLSRRTKLQRVVEEQEIDGVMQAFDRRIADGFTYGDFQFSIDARSDGFLRKGVFSCYRPVSDETPMPESRAELNPEDWMKLLYLAHADKDEVYRQYVGYYLSTNGQMYWSDEHQLSFYPEGYHQRIDPRLQLPAGTEMITELYVPRTKLAEFMHAVADELRARDENVIYGTVRLIERDDESFLAWARQPYACLVLNLHVEHSQAGQEKAAQSFRALIDRAAERDGSYYLTYHRWARRDQVERCHPRFVPFLREKARIDPRNRLQSDWLRHYQAMFA